MGQRLEHKIVSLADSCKYASSGVSGSACQLSYLGVLVNSQIDITMRYGRGELSQSPLDLLVHVVRESRCQIDVITCNDDGCLQCHVKGVDCGSP
jgi:hypothetical protein